MDVEPRFKVPAKPKPKTTGLRRSKYRTLRPSEPDPPGKPLTYNATDGRIIRRWRIGPGEFVERPVRDAQGALVRWRPYKRARIDADEVKRRYLAGESTVTIAAAMGHTPGQTSRILARAGVTTRTEFGTAFDAEEAVCRHDAGEGHVVIARSLGVSVDRVKRALRAKGRKPRRAGRVKGLGLDGGKVSYQTAFLAARRAVHDRSGGRCEALIAPGCSGQGTHVHHRKMRSQGGSNDLVNLLDTCVSCHSWIHHNTSRAFERALLVHGWDTETRAVVAAPSRRVDVDSEEDAS